MEFLKGALSALPSVASSPFAFVAYIIVRRRLVDNRVKGQAQQTSLGPLERLAPERSPGCVEGRDGNCDVERGTIS
jgi:hypothetical protein